MDIRRKFPTHKKYDYSESYFKLQNRYNDLVQKYHNKNGKYKSSRTGNKEEKGKLDAKPSEEMLALLEEIRVLKVELDAARKKLQKDDEKNLENPPDQTSPSFGLARTEKNFKFKK